jgi:hypothetical protein
MSRTRQAELIIGPLADYEGKGNTNEALRIYSSGRPQDIRIQFSVTKTISGALNELDLSVTNLKESTRNRIRGHLTRVEIKAGYLEGERAGLRLVSTGGVMSAVPVRSGADIVTNVSVLDGLGGTTRGVYRRSFGAGVPVSDIIKDVAKSMPGVELGRVDVVGTLGASGRTFSGRSAELLDKLADQWGFSWSVQDGVFQAIEDTRSFSTIHVLSYRDGSLREVRPLLSGPMQIQTGVEIVGGLNPDIRPGERVRVESSVNKSLDGTYTVHEHDLAGDTHGDEWSSTLRSLYL